MLFSFPISWALQVAYACCLSGAFEGRFSAWPQLPRAEVTGGARGVGEIRCTLMPLCARTSGRLKRWDWNMVCFKDRFCWCHQQNLSQVWLFLFLSLCGTFCSSVFNWFWCYVNVKIMEDSPVSISGFINCCSLQLPSWLLLCLSHFLSWYYIPSHTAQVLAFFGILKLCIFCGCAQHCWNSSWAWPVGLICLLWIPLV